VKLNDVHHTYGEVHEMIHRDISIGNDYRKERVKHVTTLAARIFAITVSFHKYMFGGRVIVGALIFLVLGWLMLVGSLLSGIFHFQAWENYYLASATSGIVSGSTAWRRTQLRRSGLGLRFMRPVMRSGICKPATGGGTTSRLGVSSSASFSAALP
jgi:hypothetical protein